MSVVIVYLKMSSSEADAAAAAADGVAPFSTGSAAEDVADGSDFPEQADAGKAEVSKAKREGLALLT